LISFFFKKPIKFTPSKKLFKINQSIIKPLDFTDAPVINKRNPMQENWLALITKYTNNPTLIAASWTEITENYSQKNRAYHNLTHLQNMFQELEQYKSEIEDLDVLKFAIWYHDLIYNALKKDNEERSADFAKNILSQTTFAADRIERCYQQILSTKTHQPKDSTTVDDQLMIDFDLEILSRDWETYKIYCQQIRKEYWMYPGPLFRKGRKKAMQHFLERPTIYQSSFYQQAKEAQARANIEREIAELL